VSPRKSSTSSGNRFDRPRYLLVEVAGLPSPSPRQLEGLLRARLGGPLGAAPFRVIRVTGPLALVAVAHTEAPAFRTAWNAPAAPGAGRLRTLRTFGTLRKGKAWLGRSEGGPPEPARRR
jgi:hypothetical protein